MQVSDLCHFTSAWRISCRESLLVVSSFSFYLSEKGFISMSPFKDKLGKHRILRRQIFFQYFKEFTPFSSWLHSFWWEVCSDPCAFSYRWFLSLSVFCQDFLFVFSFLQFNMLGFCSFSFKKILLHLFFFFFFTFFYVVYIFLLGSFIF